MKSSDNPQTCSGQGSQSIAAYLDRGRIATQWNRRIAPGRRAVGPHELGPRQTSLELGGVSGPWRLPSVEHDVIVRCRRLKSRDDWLRDGLDQVGLRSGVLRNTVTRIGD